MNISQTARFVVLGCAAGLAFECDVHADITTAAYDGGSNLVYEVIHMPDLDQRRMACDGVLGLANNGSMYCVPTSALNMCAYAANHGFPDMQPGNFNYQSGSNYGLATVNIAIMGAFMGTDPNNGTGGNGAYYGLKTWILTSGLSGKLKVSHYWLNPNYTPNVKKMGLKAINGHLVSFCYGRWDVVDDIGGIPVVDRNGGHCVTLSKLAMSGPAKTVWCRDPADVPTDCQQLPFSNRKLNATGIFVATCNSPLCFRPVDAIEYPSDDGRIRILDSILTISPKTGYSWSTGGNFLNLANLAQFIDFPLYNTSQLLDVGGIVDMVLDPDETGMYVLGQSDSILHHFDFFTNQMTPIVELGSPKCVVMGPKLELYAVEDEKIVCLNPIADDPITASEPLPGPPSAVMWDGAELIRILSSTERLFIDFRTGLPAGIPPTIVPIPDGIPLGQKASVALNPVDGSSWILTDASPLIYGLNKPIVEGGQPFTTVEIPNLPGQPTSISFDDAGRMFVAAAGRIFEMEDHPDFGWIPAALPEFEGDGFGDRFIVSSSRTNFSPQDHPGPAWNNNIPPEELDQSGETIEDCIADMDGDGVVGINDLLVLLGAWGDVVGFEPADIEPLGGDGVVDVNDLLRMLAFWGPCPE